MTSCATTRTQPVYFHHFVQDGEFEGQFNGVDEGLSRFFVNPLVRGDFADYDGVESDAEDVQVDQEMFCGTGAF